MAIIPTTGRAGWLAYVRRPMQGVEQEDIGWQDGRPGAPTTL